MKKIYMVSRGEYSDYCIDKVFTSRELAEEYLSLELDRDSTEYVIEEIDLIENKEEFEPLHDKDLKTKVTLYYCNLEYDTEANESKIILGSQNKIVFKKDIVNKRIFDKEIYYSFNGKIVDIFIYSLVSKEHAQKVATEKLQNYIRCKELNLPFQI